MPKVLDLDAAHYPRHALHADERLWVEKNCYVDVWIELVHSLGCESMAMLPFVVAIDFVGDQWTFYKPSHDEMRDLYGIDVQELTCWRGLLDHAAEHLGAGRLISTEADAWWLPDTSGTDYRNQHVKTTIVLNDLDIDGRRLGYFHNAGYHSLEGEDFDRSFRVGEHDPTFLPLYAELVDIDRVVRAPRDELARRAMQSLARHVRRMPKDNPVERFAQRFERDLPAIQAQGLAYYHAWAFANLRQLGSASELAAACLRWLAGNGGATEEADRFAPAIDAHERISAGSKAFVLKAARAVNTGRALDARPMMDEWSAAWQQARDTLVAATA